MLLWKLSNIYFKSSKPNIKKPSFNSDQLVANSVKNTDLEPADRENELFSSGHLGYPTKATGSKFLHKCSRLEPRT